MTPNPNPDSGSKTSTRSGRRHSVRPLTTRRTTLVGVGTVVATSLTGCLGFLGTEPLNAEEDDDSGEIRTPTEEGDEETARRTPDSSDGDVKTPESTPNTPATGDFPRGPQVLPADVRPSRGKNQQESFDPIERVYLGPIDSPATNTWDEDVNDPPTGKKLASVTVQNSAVEDWVVSPPQTHHRMDGFELTVARDATFIADGGLHYHNKCGYFGVNHLFVEENTGTIFLAYGHNPACSDSEITDGDGYWYGSVTVTGRLVGRFDRLRFVLLNGNQNLGGFSPTSTIEFEI